MNQVNDRLMIGFHLPFLLVLHTRSYTPLSLFICIHMNMYLYRYLGYLCRSDAVKSRSWTMENAKHVGLMMLDVIMIMNTWVLYLYIIYNSAMI